MKKFLNYTLLSLITLFALGYILFIFYQAKYCIMASVSAKNTLDGKVENFENKCIPPWYQVLKISKI